MINIKIYFSCTFLFKSRSTINITNDILYFVEAECPDGFSNWDQNSLYCYLLKLKSAENAKSWDVAQNNCINKTGNLASIETEQERNLVKKKLEDNDSQDHLWIGLRGPDNQGVLLKSHSHFQSMQFIFRITLIHFSFVYHNIIEDRKDKSKWKWIDGTSMAYKDWDDGEPSTNGQCGYIRTEHDCHWDDEPCENAKSFICKAPKSTFFLITTFQDEY